VFVTDDGKLDGIGLTNGVEIDVGNTLGDDDGSVDSTFDGSALGAPDGIKLGVIESGTSEGDAVMIQQRPRKARRNDFIDRWCFR